MAIVLSALFTSTAALQAAPQMRFSMKPPPARAAVSMVGLPFKLDDLPFKKDDTTELAAAAHDVIIVGAGAAGVGCAMMLTKTFGLDPSRVLLIERGEGVGDTFRRWPAEMRFISPSFNQQGWTVSMDLNSIARGTSPAFLMHTEHPSGDDYAQYLTVCAGAHDLRVRTSTEVVFIEAKGKKGGPPLFSVKTQPSQGDSQTETLGARYVVWAAGEFQYPAETSDTMAGAELCIHNSRVKSWSRLPGDDFVIIGGCTPHPALQSPDGHPLDSQPSLLASFLNARYESGADAAINLAKAGKRSTVLASTATWDTWTMDPSTELAPYTAARLREVTAAGFSPRPKFLAPLRVVRVERAAEGGFNVVAKWKACEGSLPPGTLRRSLADHANRRRVDSNGEAYTREEFENYYGGTAEWEAAAPQSKVEVTAGPEGSELVVHTPYPPVLCTGFDGSVAAAASHLFNMGEGMTEAAKGCLCGAPLLTAEDQSTIVPGVFLVGPNVRHGALSFCFVYKFRQRFGIVANAICRGLGLDTKGAVEKCRKHDMYLDDFNCCEDACGDPGAC